MNCALCDIVLSNRNYLPLLNQLRNTPKLAKNIMLWISELADRQGGGSEIRLPSGNSTGGLCDTRRTGTWTLEVCRIPVGWRGGLADEEGAADVVLSGGRDRKYGG